MPEHVQVSVKDISDSERNKTPRSATTAAFLDFDTLHIFPYLTEQIILNHMQSD